MVKMTEEVPGDESPWSLPDSMATTSVGPVCNTLITDSIAQAAPQKQCEPDHSMTIDDLREHLRLGGMVAAIDDVRALMAAHDALAERAADADRDYADMRRFQARYIEADQELRALRADAATDRELVQAAEKFIPPVLQELQFERGHGSLAVHNLRLVLIEAMKANAKHAEGER